MAHTKETDFKMNLILSTDSYKLTHWKQYPPNTEKIYSYLESRGGDFKETVFFGLQYYLLKYLTKPITRKDIEEAEQIANVHFNNKSLFNKEGWLKVLQKYKGLLPLEIRAVKEGGVYPVGTPLLTIENTDNDFFWLTNFVETLLMKLWYPITVATLSYEIKKIIRSFLELSGTPSEIDFKLHDFGCRGLSSVESAGIGGLAHLTSFKGTDTLEAIITGRDYYAEPCAGFSIPAAEHSTITTWGKENEVKAFENMIDTYADSSMAYAVVSDSYNIYAACEKLWGEVLKEKVLNKNATLIIRPDSGEPIAVINKCLELLNAKFGSTINKKGYKVLNKVRLIQGDGVDQSTIKNILEIMHRNGWSADNIAFGMGGALLQKLNRDTQKFAIKCSWAQIDGKGYNISKQPITDFSKQSKSGRFYSNDLQLVFQNGIIYKVYSLQDIREEIK